LVEIIAEAEETKIREQLDIQLLREGFWGVAIESKKVAFLMEAGFAQLLAYRLANPQQKTSLFGMIATGSPFLLSSLCRKNARSIRSLISLAFQIE
jgi:hypothetical protein